MLKKRNAQGLSINIMILAVIGLVVLFVVLFIFTKESNRSVNTLNSCEGRGGICKQSCTGNENEIPYVKCPGNDDCCISLIDPQGS